MLALEQFQRAAGVGFLETSMELFARERAELLSSKVKVTRATSGDNGSRTDSQSGSAGAADAIHVAGAGLPAHGYIASDADRHGEMSKA